MRYCDLHCDVLTAGEGVLQASGEALLAGGCALQCFAAFVCGGEGAFSRALALCGDFDALCLREGYRPVTRAGELTADGICALLTVEGGEALEGRLSALDALYRRGVRMLTLTWNRPNALGYPCFPDYEGLFTGRSSFAARDTRRGLTPFGREVVLRMNELGMLVDLAHGSEKLVYEAAALSRKPVLVSHAGAAKAYPHARNLTRAQISCIADRGGVVGLCYCADFLSGDKSAEGQRDALLAHARAIVQAGGEDCLCLGSDFDGMPPNAFLPDASRVPQLLEALEGAFGSRAAEKFACGNFTRVFREVCP